MTIQRKELDISLEHMENKQQRKWKLSIVNSRKLKSAVSTLRIVGS